MERNLQIHRKYYFPFLSNLSLYVTLIASIQNSDPSAHKTEEISKLSCHQQVDVREDKAMYNDHLCSGVNGMTWVETKIYQHL